jgi:alpha-beta hydrolase superfamily lysophospholipase
MMPGQVPSPDPPVLLVHGFASSAEHNWRQPGWLDLLADCGRETIAVDLPGHGTAPRPADPADYQDVETHVAAAVHGHGPGDGLVAALHDARLVTLRGVDHFGTTSDVRCMQAVLDFLGC